MNTAHSRLPNFFLIGAQKSGTTTLHRYLQGHPEIFLCDPKEPQFFAGAAVASPGERPPAPGSRDLEWYRSLFASAGEATAIGEASTTYSMYPFYAGVPQRLVELAPKPKLIYLVRDPVERMRSAYQHGLAAGTETRPLDVALRNDPRYLLTSSYHLQLRQWLRVVCREQILILDFDRLVADPTGLVAETLRFLEVSTDWSPPSAGERHNDSAGKRAPRGWWRAVGEGLRRAEGSAGISGQVARNEQVLRAVTRVHESRRELARRPIAAAELRVSADLERELRRALKADIDQLRGLWDNEASPAWLHT